MKMKFIRATLVCSALLFATSSCKEKKFFEDAEGQSSLRGDSWRSNVDVDQLLAGTYYLMTGNSKQSISHFHHRTVLASDEGYLYVERADEDVRNMYFGNTNNNTGLTVEDAWFSHYMMLATANKAIEVLASTDFKGFDDANRSWVPRMLGEAYFYRAFCHFNLVRMFGRPYDFTNPANNEGKNSIILRTSTSLNSPRVTVGRAYQQIVEDVEKAIELLPTLSEQINNTSKYGPNSYRDRANKDAARFLAMRVYFHMGQWAKAQEQADILIASGSYQLENDVNDAFTAANEVVGYGRANGRSREVVYQFAQHTRISTRLINDLQFNALGTVYRYPWYYWPNRKPPQPSNRDKILALSNKFLELSGWADVSDLKSVAAHQKAQADRRYGKYSSNRFYDVFAKRENQPGNDLIAGDDRDGILGGTITIDGQQIVVKGYDRAWISNGLWQRYDNSSPDTAYHDPIYYIDWLGDREDGIVDNPNPHQASLNIENSRVGSRPAAIWCMKFNENMKGFIRYPANAGQSRSFNHPLFRIAEAYLTAAYCATKTGKNSLESYLSVIQNARYEGGKPLYNATGLDALDRERMIEMAFEEDRLFYMMIRNQADGAPITFPDKNKIQPGSFSGNINWDDQRLYYSRVPLQEENTNKNAIK